MSSTAAPLSFSFVFSPASGPVGTTVVLSGTNFTSATNVFINGVSCPIISTTVNTLTTVIMPGISYGRFSVTVAGVVGQSADYFTVTTTGVPLVQLGSKLVGTGNVGASYQGYDVAISTDGTTAAIGAVNDNGGIGATWIFVKSGGSWTQQGGKLVGSANIGNSGQGRTVTLSSDGNTLAIGGDADNGNIGAVWVFTRSGTTWTEQAKLVSSLEILASQFGYRASLSGDGNTLVVGTPMDNINIGAAMVWTRSGTSWTERAKLIGTGAAGGALQGFSVAISTDGGTIAVGGDSDNAGIGAVWIYTGSGATWTQQGGKLIGSANIGSSLQGSRVALSGDGNTLLIGAHGDNANQGAAWVFTRSAGVWAEQTKLVGTGGVGASEQAISIAITTDGNTALAGGMMDNATVGATWIWARSGATWTQQGVNFIGTGAVGPAAQGIGVALSGDGNTAMTGGYTDSGAVGATWVFTP